MANPEGRPPGQPKTGGRQKGTLNRQTRDLIEILDAKGYCPIAKFIEMGAKAEKYLEGMDSLRKAIDEKRATFNMIPMNDETCNYMRIVQDSAKNIAPYLYPKRKAVELSAPGGKDIFDSLTQMFKRVADAKETK